MFLIFLLVKNYRTQKVYNWSGFFNFVFVAFLILVVAVMLYITSESPFGVILSCSSLIKCPSAPSVSHLFCFSHYN